MTERDCVFCQIIQGSRPAAIIFQDDVSIAFLDHRPLFFGHALLSPKSHHELLADLPAELVQPLFANAQTLSLAVQEGVKADGTLIVVNNKVSQSVPHLHVHVIPRRFSDGLKGFFWPRQRYADAAAIDETAKAIGEAFTRLRKAPDARS